MRRLGVLLFVVVVASACGGDDSSSPTPVADGDENAATGLMELCPGSSEVEPEQQPVGEIIELTDEGSDHVACASYAHRPPASGDHFEAWQNCGSYTTPIMDQSAVHALEHGAVWVAYQPDLDPAMVQQIRRRLGVERHGLSAPYPGLANPIVLTAWTRQLAVDDWADPMVEEFLGTYVGAASPTAPEGGVSCEGAIGDAPDDPNANLLEILEQLGLTTS